MLTDTLKNSLISLVIREMQIKKPKWDITSYLLEWLVLKDKKITSASEDMGKMIHFCTVVIINWFSHYGNTMEFPQKIKNRNSNSTPGHISKGKEYCISCTPMLTGTLFIITATGKQVSISIWMDKEKVALNTHSKCNIFSHLQ